jgi:hypothetical protein
VYGGVEIMAIESPPALKGMDITSNISQLKGAYPQGAARKALSEILKGFAAETGLDLSYVDVIDLNGKTMSLLNFVKQVESSNNLPMVSLLQKSCKDPDNLAKNVFPQAQKIISDQKWHSGTPMVRITLDLRMSQAKQKTGNNTAAGQGAVELKNVNVMNGKVAETGSTAASDEKSSEIKLVYSENWLVKVLMNDLGYKDKA